MVHRFYITAFCHNRQGQCGRRARAAGSVDEEALAVHADIVLEVTAPDSGPAFSAGEFPSGETVVVD
jgi:hypothetical protein